MSTNQAANLVMAALLIMFVAIACTRSYVGKTDADAPGVERGRLKFSKSLDALRIGDDYAYREVDHHFFFEGKLWQPEDDKELAQRVGNCDTSPNPEVEILRCFGDATEGYNTTYIISVRDGKPAVTKLDEGGASVWINEDGRWLLFRKFFFNVESGEKKQVKGMPFADDPKGSAPVQYVVAISPDMKTVVAKHDHIPETEGDAKYVTIRVIEVETGTVEIRKVNFTKYPWLNDHKNPEGDFIPPPEPQRHFVWKKDASGRERILVPELGRVVPNR